MKKKAVVVDSLTKIYDKPRVKAVDNVSFEVYQGEIFGFLGPNGAGKTTTISILVGLRKPTNGRVRVLGYDPTDSRELQELKNRMGFLAQDFTWFENTTVKETLHYYYRLYNRKNKDIIDKIVELLDLKDHFNKKFSKLSGGLKRRVGVATALVGDPDIVFLDEPTTGLDPQARRRVWDALKQLKREGKTIFLTTHYMEEAEYLCDRIAIILDGRIQVLASPSEIIERYGGGYTIEFPGVSEEEISPILKTIENARVIKRDEALAVWFVGQADLYMFLSKLLATGIRFEFNIKRPSLETAFLNIVGKRITVEGELA